METYLPPSEPTMYPPTPGMLPINGNPGAGQLASGFETLNLNQLPPNNEIMNAFSQFLSNQRSSPMLPPTYHQHHPSTSSQSMIMRGREGYGPPGFNRNGSSRDRPFQPYSRPDDNYY